MQRTKQYMPVARTAETVGTVVTPTIIQRAAAAPKTPAKPAPKPAPVAKPTTPTIAQSEVNEEPDFVAAGIVPIGKPASAGRVEIVAPAATYTPSAGMELRGFIHRDGSAVKFAGAAGAVLLDRGEAQEEFGGLVWQARALLQAYPAPQSATKAPKPATKAAKPNAVQRLAESNTSRSDNAGAAVQTAATHSPGQPLSSTTRTKLESSFGTDLSSVRVHTDSTSDTAARSVQAHAYTTGQDIYFRSGRYRPDTNDGQKLLAHEVAHTVQQTSAPSQVAKSADTELNVSQPGDHLEREAENAAEHVMRGERAPIRSVGTTVPLARLADTTSAPAPVTEAKQAPAPTAPAPTKAPANAPPSAPNNAGGQGAPAPVKGQPKGETPPAAPPKVNTDKAGPPAEGGGGGDGLAVVTRELNAAGAEQKQHEPASQKVDETSAAVGDPPNADVAAGKEQQVDAMGAAKPTGKFNREAFKKAVRAKIQEIQVNSVGDAKNLKENDGARAVADTAKGEVATNKEQVAGGVTQAANATPTPVGTPKKGSDVPATDTGAVPKVDATKAVPSPVPEEQVSKANESKQLDEQMTTAKVTPEQLAKANEPQFQAALTAKNDAQTQAEALPAQARASEQNALSTAKKDVATTTQTGLGGMNTQRGELLGQTKGVQTEAKQANEAKRAEIAKELEEIYSQTQTNVTTRLKTLDDDVKSTLDFGIDAAKAKFYLFLTVELIEFVAKKGLLAIWEAFTGSPEYTAIFDRGRQQFQANLDQVVDDVATVVEKALDDVVGMIARGKEQLETAVARRSGADKELAQEVAQGVQGKFADLEKQVEAKQGAIIESVAQRIQTAQKEVDDLIKTLKDPVGAVIDYAKETIGSVLEIIANMRKLLMGALAKAAEAIDLILADPIGFLGNLVAGVKQGVLNFLANIETHLKKGLMDWLFGAITKAGIQLPEKFDLSGLLSIALQVLGLTWSNIRKRAVAIVGEPVVSALEKASEIFITLVTKGPAGLWEYIKEQAMSFLDTLKEGIKSFVIETVIKAGVKWLLGLLNPASAFVKACMAIYDIINWVMTKGQQLMEFVNAVLDSVLSIAKGNIGPAAAAVENALAKAVPVAIGFLANLAGLGDLSGGIKKAIEKIQAPVNSAIDWLIKKAVQLVKAIGKMFGGGKKEEKPDERTPEQKQEDLNKAVAEGEGLLADPELTTKEILGKLPRIQKKYRLSILTIITDTDEGDEEVVHIQGKGSPETNGKSTRRSKSKYYTILKSGDRKLRPKYRGSRRIRRKFYNSNRRYVGFVYTAMAAFLEKRTDPKNKSRWLENRGGEKVSVPKSNITVAHDPQVVAHWNRYGFNAGHQSRVNWYNFIGRESDLFFQSREVNSGDQTGETYQDEVGPNFKGPGEDSDE